MSSPGAAFSLADQRVLIVGASSGIGRATAELVSGLGGHPILASRSADRLEAVRADLVEPENASIAAFDFLDAEAVKSAFGRIEGLDHVIISAVADENKKRAAFVELDRATMEASFDKFWGQINVLQAALPVLRRDGFASVAGIKPAGKNSGLSVMNAVQAGIIQLARSLAVELAPLRVNVVAPGVVLTNVWTDGERQDLEKWMRSSLPAQRAGKPVHIAQAVIGMMANPYQTGVVLPVDGGLLLT